MSKSAPLFAGFGRHPNSSQRTLKEVRHDVQVGIWVKFTLSFRSGQSQHESVTLHLRGFARDARDLGVSLPELTDHSDFDLIVHVSSNDIFAIRDSSVNADDYEAAGFRLMVRVKSSNAFDI